MLCKIKKDSVNLNYIANQTILYAFPTVRVNTCVFVLVWMCFVWCI